MTIQCRYPSLAINSHLRKYWCRLGPPAGVCRTVVSTNRYTHLRYRGRVAGPAAPPLRLRELHEDCALLVTEAWRETVQRYEDEVRELEEALRRGRESRREAEEETRLCAQEAEALRREVLELEQLRALLEEELLRVREASELQAEERQVGEPECPRPGPGRPAGGGSPDSAAFRPGAASPPGGPGPGGAPGDPGAEGTARLRGAASRSPAGCRVRCHGSSCPGAGSCSACQFL